MSKFNIILTGFMGTGKTTIGKLLAEKLKFKFVDTDQLIEKTTGKTISAIFKEDGEKAFRNLERKIAKKLSKKKGQVISTGGRLMLDSKNVKHLSPQGQIFCLFASSDTILQRVLSDHKSIKRPLLKGPDPKSKIMNLLSERKEMYGAFLQINTDDKSPEEVMQLIIEKIKY